MTFCLSTHGGGRRQDVNPERGKDEHIRGRSMSASMVGGSSSSIAVSTTSTGTVSGNTALNLEQFSQMQLKEMQMQIDLMQKQLNHQVMKTSRSNTFGKKYSRIRAKTYL